MLLDANLLIYAVDERSPLHPRARDWLTDQLNGSRRVGLPWQSLGTFLRITTHPRIFERPLGSADAWARVEAWLAAPMAWTPSPGPRHGALFGSLVAGYGVTGNLVPDAQLAALALEHGLEICSADSDFAMFTEIRWINPVG